MPNNIQVENNIAAQGVEQVEYKQEFNKVLTTRDLVIFGIVFMAPIAVQGVYGQLAQESHGETVLAFIIGLVAMLFTAHCYGKMAQAFPVAGSTYAYTSRAIHSNVGFIAGWSILLGYLVLPMMVMKLCTLFLGELLPFPQWVLVLMFVVPVTIFNILGAQTASKVNLFMTILMLLSIIVFVIFSIKALMNGVGYGQVFTFKGIYNPDTFSWNGLVTASSLAVVSFIGFDGVTTMAEDSSVSGKQVGKAAIMAVIICAVFYIAQAYFALIVHPNVNDFKSADTAFFEVATIVGGQGLAIFCTLIIAIAGITITLAGQAAASRILYSMGRDKVLPQFFNRLHPKYKTPVNSILFLAVIGYFGAVLIPLSVFFSVAVFGVLIGFIFVDLSVFVEYFLKRKQRSGVHFFSNLLFPILGMIICSFILLNMDPIGKIVGFSWVGIGILYLLIATKGFRQSASIFSDSSFE